MKERRVTGGKHGMCEKRKERRMQERKRMTVWESDVAYVF